MDDMNVLIAKFANGLQHKSLTDEDVSGLSEVISGEQSESSYVLVCNILFTYYARQYGICTTDIERNSVIDAFIKMYRSIFGDLYLSTDVVICIFKMRVSHDDMDTRTDMMLKISEDKSIQEFKDTYVYVYKHLIDYIIDRSMFCDEPYAGILNTLLERISSNEDIDGKSPNYLD